MSDDINNFPKISASTGPKAKQTREISQWSLINGR